FLGFKGVSISNRDIFALDVLAVVLGQGKSSRLYREVYKNKQLVYSVGAFNFTPLDKGIFAIKALIEKQKSEKAIKAILAEIDKIKSRGIDNQELKKAKKQVLSDYLFSRQTTAGVARDIALNEILVGDADFSQRYVEAVKNLTKENIQGVAKKYLNKQTLTIIALSPLSSKEEAKKEIELKKTEIKKIVLDNGLAVLLKEDATFPLVSIKVFFRGGLRAETKENNGISNLTSRLLLAGTKDRSAEDIDISIESLGASLDSFSGNNSFGISLEMLSADIDQGIAILADLLSNPVFSDAELKHEKEKALAQIKADEDSVFKVAFKLLKKTLLGEHPYRFDPLGEEESLKKLTRKEIIEFYKKFCVPNNMVLTVFGDIESEKVLQLIKDKFAKLSAGKLPQISLPESFPEKFKEITISAPKEQAVIMLGFAGVSITAPDRYPLEVLNALMTSMSGRLYQEIREKSGQAYTLGGSSVLGIERGFYYFYVSTTFENVERVKEIILREIKNLQTDFVSDDELSKVKVYLCGWQKFNLETNSALSLEAGFDELYGLGFNNYKLYQEKISQVSKEEIMRVAKTYLNLDKAVTVILRSKENTSPQ
ncbi:MAG: M16 family metallopeptidase, partial [Candidatus Omnitrophota bacterium]